MVVQRTREARGDTHRADESPEGVQEEVVARSDAATVAEHVPDRFVRDVKVVALESWQRRETYVCKKGPISSVLRCENPSV